MPDSPTLKPANARVTLVTALAWRAIAEIARRRHSTHAFGLRQIHPGASIRGLLELQLHCASTGRALPAIDFNLGGPSGTWSTGAGAQGNFLALLEPEPGTVIDRIEEALGLPPFRGMVPASSTEALAVRVVAGLAESRVFDRHGWRTTLGAYGAHSGDVAADWAGSMGVEVDAPGSDCHLTSDAHDRLSRLVMIHRAPDECPVGSLSHLEGRGLLVDIETGRIASAERGGVKLLGELWPMHVATGGSMERLLARLVAEF